MSVLLTPVFPVPTIYLAHLGCSKSMCRIKIEPYTWELLGWWTAYNVLLNCSIMGVLEENLGCNCEIAAVFT